MPTEEYWPISLHLKLCSRKSHSLGLRRACIYMTKLNPASVGWLIIVLVELVILWNSVCSESDRKRPFINILFFHQGKKKKKQKPNILTPLDHHSLKLSEHSKAHLNPQTSNQKLYIVKTPKTLKSGQGCHSYTPPAITDQVLIERQLTVPGAVVRNAGRPCPRARTARRTRSRPSRMRAQYREQGTWQPA